MWPLSRKPKAARRTVLYSVEHSDAAGETFNLTVHPSGYGVGLVHTPDNPHEWDILYAGGKTKHDNVSWLPAAGWSAGELIAAGFPPAVAAEAPVPEVVMLARAVLSSQADLAAAFAFLDAAVEAAAKYQRAEGEPRR